MEFVNDKTDMIGRQKILPNRSQYRSGTKKQDMGWLKKPVITSSTDGKRDLSGTQSAEVHNIFSSNAGPHNI